MEYCAYCGNPTETVSYAPCPKCGNPTNGAPRPVPVAATSGANTALVLVLVVVGVLVLVAVIGILAAIAIPNLLTAKQRAMQKRTMADIRMIATAAEAYASDNNAYPESLNALAPKYMKVVPTRDGWGHQFEYECLTDETGKCTGYVIVSGGKNGHPDDGVRELVAHPRGATTNFDCDIVYSNGTFVEYPEGVQR
jgi:type II secretory pathway pseudopilin PulG